MQSRYLAAMTGAVLLSGGALGHAALSGLLDSTAPVTGGNTAFNYRLNLSGDDRLDHIATASNSPAGTFVTIYDIPGFQSVNVSAANWISMVQLTGLTPSTIAGSGFDNPNLVNVTFLYNGPMVDANNTTVSFTGFQIISSLHTVNTHGMYSGQDTLNTGGSSGTTVQADGFVGVPDALPEPAALVLAGLLPLMMRRRERCKQTAPTII